MEIIKTIVQFFRNLFSTKEKTPADSKSDKKATKENETFRATKPKTFIAIISIIVLAILFSIGFLIYLKVQPEKARITARAQAPRLTPLRENAKPYPLYINFNGSVAKLEDIHKVITSGIKMSPQVEGEWKWTQDNQLEFTPSSDWPAGTEFTIDFSDDLFPEHVILDEYEETFKTAHFRINVQSNKFYIDPTNEDLKQVSAMISFSHPVNIESFEKKVSLHPVEVADDITAFEDREYKITITYDAFFGKAYILSEALPMPEDDVIMLLTVDKGVEPMNKGEESTDEVKSPVTIPGITKFIKINSLTQTMVRNEEYKLEQIVVVDTKGKVRIKDLSKNMEAWVLPRDLPETPGIKAQKNYHWRNPAMVGPEILKLSTKLVLDPIEGEHEYENINSFKIKSDPNKFVYFKIKGGTPFYGKYKLYKDYDRILKIERFPKQLEIMHEGIILSSTGAKKVSIVAQGLDGVQFRIGRVQPDQLNHLVTQSNGDLTDIRFQNYRFNEDNLVENKYKTRTLASLPPGEPNYFSFDFSPYLQSEASGKVKNGIFFFEVREWDPGREVLGGKYSKRLIMISDLGILTKDGADDSHDIFVQSISQGIPVSGARVQVLGKNGIPVLSRLTDSNGHVSIPSLNSFRKEKTPTVYIISKGEDLTFLPFKAPGRWLNYSKFDVGGEHGTTAKNKINAFLFSDRGIYRPGDLFNIAMIVKSGNWKTNLAGTPMEATISDPRGLEIYRQKFKLSTGGFDELSYTTEHTSPTGTYQINLYNIVNEKYQRLIGSTTIRVEEFLPDRLNISSVFPGIKDEAWVSPENLKAMVTLRNLFGTPARENRIAARMALTPGRMWFYPYRDFTFNDPYSYEKYYTENLVEKYTDEDGKAFFDFNLDRFEPATYSLVFTADGFEKESGRNVSTESRIMVSPLKYLIGTKANGDLSYIYKNAGRKLKVIAINPSLKKIDVPDVRFELNEIKHISVLTKLNNGTYAYKSVEKAVPLNARVKNIPASGLDFVLSTENPGEYELIITNKAGIEFSRVRYSVVGMGNITRSLDKTSELEIKLNKKDYEPGEEIEVYVKAPYTGSGLITIERDRVYSYQWFNSSSSSFLKKIKIPADLEGNGYINVSFVRSAASKEIYMSPLSYGIAPFYISKKNRTNPVTITIPPEARSGKEFPISYKTEGPAKIVVYAVDEGILQVANYNTPDPLAYFFKKRALEVRTSQLLDLILPEFRLLQNNAAMGGGMGFEEIAKNLNPFKRKSHKPVVFWSGIIDSDRKERTLRYKVPDYFNGTLRVMAIAVSQNTIGRSEEKSIVKNPFIISPNLPMFAAPNDSFLATVTITNGIDGSTKKSPINLEVQATPHLKVTDAKRKIFLNEDGDSTLTFKIKVNNMPGVASLTFTASGHNETTSLASYMSIRPAIPYQTTITTGVVKDDDVDIDIPRQLYKEFRVLDASVSFLPVGLSKGLVSYLDQYPYGCTEQVVSQAFPYLYLKDVNGFGIDDSKASEKIKYAIKVLQARQNSDGKFGIWAANSHTSDFITAYGMHFLTECKKAGYYVSENLFNNTLSALKNIAREKKSSLNEIRVQTYAIYLLTRNEIITTNYISAVRKILESKYKNWDDELTGGYLAASYMLMRQNDEANSIFDETIDGQLQAESSWHFCDHFIQNTQLLYLLSEHAPQKLEDVSERIIKEIARIIGNGWYNSINSAYAIMALTKYTAASGQPTSKVVIKQLLKNSKEETLKLPQSNFPTVAYSPNAEELNIENSTNLNLFYQVVQGGFNIILPDERVSKGIEIYREYRTKSGGIADKVSLGDEVTVHIKMRSLEKYQSNIAIVDMLPAGLEAVPTSVRDNISGSWNPEYTDIREDRLVIFGNLNENVMEFTYTVRAINRGTFIVPPLYGESMYNREIYGYAPQDPITVE